MCDVMFTYSLGRERKLSGSGLRHIGDARRVPPKGVIQAKVLQPGQDAELALQDALVGTTICHISPCTRFTKLPCLKQGKL